GIRTSSFFGYNGTYTIASNLTPGYGYWVNVSEPGELILSSSVQTPAANRIRIVTTSELPPDPPDAVSGTGGIPDEFLLEQNYPNPFNPSTTIRYELPIESRVTLRIYNVLGEEVASLVDGIEQAGSKAVQFQSPSQSSGIYYYTLVATGVEDLRVSFRQIRKM